MLAYIAGLTKTSMEDWQYGCLVVAPPDADVVAPGTPFTCFTGIKVQMQYGCLVACAVHAGTVSRGTQFTCFTGIKVQILALSSSLRREDRQCVTSRGPQFTCFAGIK